MAIQRTRGERIFDAVNTIVLFILSAITLYPLLYVLFASVSEPGPLMSHRGLLLAPLGVHVKVVEPGVILTDFSGRSFDFNNDPGLDAYQPLVQSVMSKYGPMMANGSQPEQIAEVVYAAATDTGDQLRFEAGEDAIRTLAARRAADDTTFFAGMKAQFIIGA